MNRRTFATISGLLGAGVLTSAKAMIAPQLRPSYTFAFPKMSSELNKHVDGLSERIWDAIKYCDNSRNMYRDFMTPVEILKNEQGSEYQFSYKNALGNKVELKRTGRKKKTIIK
jgi:hypothetical protein